MGFRFAALISPVLFLQYSLFFALFGVWLLVCARLLERVGDYDSRLSRKIRRRLLAGDWLLYLRLGGTYLVLVGSMALLLSLGHLRWTGKASAPWVDVTVTSPQPVTGPPHAPSDAPHYEEIVLVLTGAALLLFGSRYRRFVPAFAGSALLLIGITPTIKNEFKFDNHFKGELSLPGGTVETVQRKFVELGIVGNFLPGCGDFAGSGCGPGQTLEFYSTRQPTNASALFTKVCKGINIVD